MKLLIDLDDGNHEELKLEIQRFIRVVVHVYQRKCRDPNCSISDCQLVKEVFLHLIHCKVPADDCVFCIRVITAIRYHAVYCKDTKCLVPGCLQKRYGFQQGFKLLQQAQSSHGCMRISSNAAIGVPSSPEAASSLSHNRRGLQKPVQTVQMLQPPQMVSGGPVKWRLDEPECDRTSASVGCLKFSCLKRCLKGLFHWASSLATTNKNCNKSQRRPAQQ